ncbi:hypothetical protein FDUTEX481_06889 [Tolypothrix sp. PCC 7601]|nr:hypothetical protein FDUTEX481_06889 [Tolypothrix sp. PCC 7601]
MYPCSRISLSVVIYLNYLLFGIWGLGVGVWVLVFVPIPHFPLPLTQSPIPSPQSLIPHSH